MKHIAITALLCLAATTAGARQDSDTIVPSVRELPGVVVNGASAANTLAATAPLRLMSSDEMLRFGVADIADALHRLPGITVRDYGGAGGMKTVSVRGFGTKHTGVSYDGVMLSQCQSGEIDLARYSLDNLESLALVVGDNADIFIPARQASYPATIAISTLRHPATATKPDIRAQLRVGSFGYVSPLLCYAQNIGNRLSISLTGDYVYAENDYPYTLQNGQYTEHKRRTNSMMNAGHAELGFSYAPTAHSSIEGKLYYYDNDRELPGTSRYYTDISLETLHDRNAFAQLHYRARYGSRVSLRWLGKLNWAASDYRNGAYADGLNDAKYWQREAYTALCVLYAPTQSIALDYSLDYSYNNLNSTLSTDTRPLRHTLLQSVTAKYSRGRLTAMARLLSSLYFNKAKDGPGARDMRRLSPSASLSVRLLSQEQLYARVSYKNIFRAPTFNESYFFHYGSTDLQPETTDQLNLGLSWRHTFAQRLTVDVAADAYANSIDDMIVAVPMNMFVWRTINVGKVRSHGIEATLNADCDLGGGCRLLLAGSYTWQKCEDHTNSDSKYYGLQIAYTPEHQGSAALSLENPWLCVSANVHGVSRRYTTNEHYDGTRVSGYTELGATAYRQFSLWKQRVELRLDVKNLLNHQYCIVAKYPMPGRSWQITLKWQY